jgi:hypothetical protein
VALLRPHGHAETADPTECDDSDIVVTMFLSQCGWKLHSPPDIANAGRVIMFLVRQLGHLRHPENLWVRLLDDREIPVEVSKVA